MSALATVVVAGVLTIAAPATATPPTATTTVLGSDANPSTSGQAVTLTATVTGTAPTGTVAFAEGATPLATVAVTPAGTASLVISTFSVGAHALTATYSGDSGNDPSMGSLTQTVVAPPLPPAPPPPPRVKKPKVTLVASTHQVEVGDKVQLRWHTKHADSVKASGDWGGEQKAKGSATIRVTDRGKHVFKLTATNASGAKTAKVVVMAARKAKELELVVTDELTLTGSKVDVSADGLAKGEDFTLRLNDKVLLTGKADKHGDVVRTIQIPKTTPEGEIPLTITGSNPGRVGTAVLNVIVPKKLDVSVAQAEVMKRDQQTITVTGLFPGETYTVTSAGAKLTSGTADEAGSFTYTFRATKPLGEHKVTVTGAVPSRVGTVSFTVLDPGRGPNNGG